MMTEKENDGIPQRARNLYRQGLDFSIEGDPEKAIDCLGKATEIAPGFCSAYNVMGNCLDRLGQYEEAIRTYEKVIELDPFHAGARFKRDLVLLKILRVNDGDPVTRVMAGQKTGTPRAGDPLVPAGAESQRFFRWEL